MKKVLSLVLALVLVCGLAINAMALGFDMSVDANLVQSGETVTAKVTLDEPIEGAMQVQLELNYNWDVLSYSSHTLGEGFEVLSVTPSSKNPVIKISWVDLTFTGANLPAGTVIEVVFTAKEAVDAADVAMTVTAKVDGAAVTGDSVAVTVCPGHSYVETKSEASCLEPATIVYTCEYCGDSYNGESDGVYGDHDLTWVEGTVTCTEDGLMEHYKCNVCGKLYGVDDWECTTELTEDDLFMEAGHQETNWPAEEFHDDGSITREYYCVLCNEVLRTETVYPGEAGNPIYVYPMETPVTTVEVPAGGSIFYQLSMFGGNYVVITGGDFTVNATTSGMMGMGGSTATYKSQNGVVKFMDTASRWSATTVEIVNNGSAPATFTITVEVPMGAMDNPAQLYIGENTATTYEGIAGYYMQWVADCNGTFTVTLTNPGSYWGFYIYNTTSGVQTDDHQHDGDGVMTDSVEVSIGDVVLVHLMNSNFDENAGWVYPAGDITFEASIAYKHNIQHVEAVAPSCFAEGNIEYWYCADCGYAWADADLTQVTNLKSVVLPAACQDVKHVEAVAPSCFEEGNIEYWYCTNPEHGTVWIDEALMQISNHMSVKLAPWCQDVVHVEAVEPGCHFIGNVEHWYCTNPDHGTVWTDEARTEISNHNSVILPAKGGDVEHHEAVAATCTESARCEFWYCPECDQYWLNAELTQLTNRLSTFVSGPNGHQYDDDKDMVCNVCDFDRTNSVTGDFTIVAAVAAAVVSMTGIVALPIAKKKFF